MDILNFVGVSIFIYDSQVCPGGKKCNSHLEPMRTDSYDI